MAGIVTHIAVADSIMNRFPDKINNRDMFLCGNLAPDCIHAREGFVREDKKHTHLRDGVADKDFLSEENIALFRDRLKRFAAEYYGEAPELTAGYLSHLLTDEYFHRTVRKEYIAAVSEIGVEQSDREFFNLIIRDLDIVDRLTAGNYPLSFDVADSFARIYGAEVRDYLSRDEVERSLCWILDTYFAEDQQALDAPRYYGYQRSLKFIGEAAEFVYLTLSSPEYGAVL